LTRRWQIDTKQQTLVWDCETYREDHVDFIEMSGLYTSTVITYGVQKGALHLGRHIVFPTHRIFPNDTHGSWQMDVPEEAVPSLILDGEAIREIPLRVTLDGTVKTVSLDGTGRLLIIRTLFPATDRAALCERIEYQNVGTEPIALAVHGDGAIEFCRVRGPYGLNIAERTACLRGLTDGSLAEGEVAVLTVAYTARMAHEACHEVKVDEQLKNRLKRVDALTSPLTMETGNALFDTMFHFAKIRSGESIFRTKNGDVHSPGGTAYYAAVWCNDQAEYAGPWQAWTGDELQLNAAYNAYAWYYPHMDGGYEPIPSSIIAEGTGFWNGAGDRGDAAMYLFGATRYALVSGRLGEDRALLKAIMWCAEYCLRKMDNAIHRGLIPSDADELEGRLPAGKINLSTNMLALGGFRSAARLAEALGETALSVRYHEAAGTLERESEVYFAATLHGFDTYRYYDGNETLRSWICLPLCMDIATRTEGTVKAITSPYLFSEAGQLSEEGNTIAWDRSTLYGLRGMYRAAVILSETDAEAGKRYRKIATDYLLDYCEKRLLGDHVPYAVEAYPEGGQRHLSAESALFCQIITEGILAITPLSFSSFSFHTVIPEELPYLTLTNVHAFGETFSLAIRDGRWELRCESGKVFSGLCQGRVTVEF